MATHHPVAISVVGRSGSGKTTLCTDLLSALRGRGLTCGAIKHAGHALDLDSDGKDSARLQRAGGSPTIVVGPDQLAWVAGPLPTLEQLLGLMPESLDVVLVEGFRSAGLPTILIAGRDPEADGWTGPSGEVLLRVDPYDGPEWPAGDVVGLAADQVVALVGDHSEAPAAG